MSAALVIRNLTVDFGGSLRKFRAVEDVSLEVAAGQTLGVVGESGSGKSVTAMSALRLHPAGSKVEILGHILWKGTAIEGADERTMRGLRGRQMGVIFQEPMSCLNPLMRVGEQVREAVIAHDVSTGNAARQRVLSLLQEVGLPQPQRHYGYYPHELSGGQQQRVMIAMALAGDPELLIADEPTTALDVTIQAQIVALLRRIQQERGMAMLFISHDLALVGRIADTIAVMRHGRVVEQGPARQIFADPKHPYTRALLACHPDGRRQPRTHLPVLSDFLGDTGDGNGRQGRQTAAEAVTAIRPDATVVLDIDTLTVAYRRGLFGSTTRAVDGVSLALSHGRTLGIVGESGSGKSSVAKAVIGLAPISGGRIHLLGQDVGTASASQRKVLARRCQYVFQNSLAAMNPRLRIRDIIAEPLRVHGLIEDGNADDRLVMLLEEVGLERAHLRRFPHELSGGQRQRVCIARALALDPDVLICDEIVSALDVTVQAQVLNLLLDLQADRGVALLFISHDLLVVRHIADTIAVMKDGRLVEHGSAADMFDRPQDHYTRTLLSAAAGHA
jgi:peptide/nickel transport system ATP-binding protein